MVETDTRLKKKLASTVVRRLVLVFPSCKCRLGIYMRQD